MISLILLSAGLAAAPPPYLQAQGTLRSAGGEPVDGTYAMTFALYAGESDTTALWIETYPAIAAADGVFHTTLGAGNVPLSVSTLSAAPGLWFGVAIGGEPELPRVAMSSVPYAFTE